MAVKDYTARIMDKRAKIPSYDNLDYTPLAIPVGMQLPETSNQTMARMMLSSGMISLDDYHKMIGVVYDGDYNEESEHFTDEFEDRTDRFQQSRFAQYEDDIEFAEAVRMDTANLRTGEVPPNDSGSSEGRQPDDTTGNIQHAPDPIPGEVQKQNPATQSANPGGNQ